MPAATHWAERETEFQVRAYKMTRRFSRFVIASGILSLILAATAAAQDFQKSYRIAAGGPVRIGNVSGDVIVRGYDGDAIIVKGYKEGPDRDRLDVEDRG